MALVLSLGNLSAFAEITWAPKDNAQLVEEIKYIRLYKAGMLKPLAQADHDHNYYQSTKYVPDGAQVYIEFNMERSQEIRLEVEDANGALIGEIITADFEGQWGDLDGVDYDPHRAIANRIKWDGTYTDLAGERKTLGDYDSEGKLLLNECTFYIRFRPTDVRMKDYSISMKVIIDYSDEAVLKNLRIVGGNLQYVNPLCKGGDPVDMISGNFTWEHTDLSLRGARPLMFSRHYNAMDKTDHGLGVGWRHNYMIQLVHEDLYTTVTMSDGFNIYFDNGRDGTFYAPDSADVSLEKEGSGYVLTSRDKTRHHFDAAGYLIAIEDANQKQTTIERNGAEISSISNDSGTLTFEYTDGKITTITDSADRVVSYDYAGNDLVMFTDADGSVNSYGYTGDHYLETITDFTGEVYLSNVYDELGRVTEQTLIGEGTSTFEYDFVNNQSTFVDPEGDSFVYYYDDNQRITALEDRNGQITYIYENGRVKTQTDRIGNEWGFVYDAYGNPTDKTYPDGTSETFEYNDLSQVTRHVRRDGTVLSYSYDGLGNLLTFTDAMSKVTSFTYFPGTTNLETVTDPVGNMTSFTYDEKGNVLT